MPDVFVAFSLLTLLFIGLWWLVERAPSVQEFSYGTCDECERPAERGIYLFSSGEIYCRHCADAIVKRRRMQAQRLAEMNPYPLAVCESVFKAVDFHYDVAEKILEQSAQGNVDPEIVADQVRKLLKDWPYVDFS